MLGFDIPMNVENFTSFDGCDKQWDLIMVVISEISHNLDEP